MEITRFDAFGGGCIRADQMAAFRCGITADPVLAVGRQRFVGGRFAVSVPSIPSGSASLGHSRATAVFARPGRPPALFVRRAGRLERWLPLPALGEEATPDALFLGDSIMVASHRAIAAALPSWSTQFDARVGRATAEGVEVASHLRIAGRDAVVVELGTNEGSAERFPDLSRSLLARVRAASLVVWVTVHRNADFVPELNDDIRRAVAAIPNGVVADWDHAVPPDGLLTDGIHPTDAGKRAMAALLARVLDPWYLAATGRGDTACAPPELD